jgi:hypothetical protein
VDIGALIERPADEILHLLAGAAGNGADDAADGAADRVGGVADGAARLERARERRRHHEPVGLPGNVERSARYCPMNVGIRH